MYLFVQEKPFFGFFSIFFILAFPHQSEVSLLEFSLSWAKLHSTLYGDMITAIVILGVFPPFEDILQLLFWKIVFRIPIYGPCFAVEDRIWFLNLLVTMALQICSLFVPIVTPIIISICFVILSDPYYNFTNLRCRILCCGDKTCT